AICAGALYSIINGRLHQREACEQWRLNESDRKSELRPWSRVQHARPFCERPGTGIAPITQSTGHAHPSNRVVEVLNVNLEEKGVGEVIVQSSNVPALLVVEEIIRKIYAL